MRRRSARCGVRDNEVNAMTDETDGYRFAELPGVRCACRCRRYRVRGVRVQLLGRTQAFKPLNMQAQASPAMANPALLSEATLKIVKGPQIGSSFRLAADRLTVGRSPQCDIPRRHDGFAHACDHRTHAGRLPH